MTLPTNETLIQRMIDIGDSLTLQEAEDHKKTIQSEVKEIGKRVDVIIKEDLNTAFSREPEEVLADVQQLTAISGTLIALISTLDAKHSLLIYDSLSTVPEEPEEDPELGLRKGQIKPKKKGMTETGKKAIIDSTTSFYSASIKMLDAFKTQLSNKAYSLRSAVRVKY